MDAPVLGQGNWTQEKQHIDRRIWQIVDRDRGRITRRTMTYENQAQVEAHESPRGRRLPWQLRCASERDEWQMPSAADGHTPPAGPLSLVEIGLREYAGQVPQTQAWCGR